MLKSSIVVPQLQVNILFRFSQPIFLAVFLPQLLQGISIVGLSRFMRTAPVISEFVAIAFAAYHKGVLARLRGLNEVLVLLVALS